MRALTELQMLCRADQTAAARRDFIAEWSKWRLKLVGVMPESEIAILETACWKHFKKRKLGY